jgi:hypothetical protein
MKSKISKLLVWVFLVLTACSNNQISDIQPSSTEENPITFGEGSVGIKQSGLSEDRICVDAPLPTFTDFQVYQVLKTTEPLVREEFIDPVFGTCIVRVTDRDADPSSDDPSTGLKNEYSRVQSFNADESLIMVRGTEATWYIYDAYTLQPLTQIDIGTDPRWDAQDPGLLYFSDATFLYSYNVYTVETTLVYDFSNEFPGTALAAVWTRYEGSPSMDSHYYG